jgi:RHS repeat-associated protein
MVYDGENNRLARIDADGTQNLFVAGHEIVVDTQGVMHATRTYAHNGEMIATRSTDTGLTWIGTTHQGTAAWAISAATLALTYRRQDPFGNERGDAVTWTATQQGFHTGTEDPTGLVSMGARFYDPTTGRFISRDPIRAYTDSQQINGYSYSSNNPINMSDPTGLWSCIDGDCSYHNNDGSLKNEEQCKKTGCGTGQCTKGSCGSTTEQPPMCELYPFCEGEGSGNGTGSSGNGGESNGGLTEEQGERLLEAATLTIADYLAGEEVDPKDLEWAKGILEWSLSLTLAQYGAGGVGVCATVTVQVIAAFSTDKCLMYTTKNGWITSDRLAGGAGLAAGASMTAGLVVTSAESANEIAGIDYYAEFDAGEGVVVGMQSAVSAASDWIISVYAGTGYSVCYYVGACKWSIGVGNSRVGLE